MGDRLMAEIFHDKYFPTINALIFIRTLSTTFSLIRVSVSQSTFLQCIWNSKGKIYHLEYRKLICNVSQVINFNIIAYKPINEEIHHQFIFIFLSCVKNGA